MSLNIIPSCLPKRWEVASLIFFGLMANYSLRLNLSIAIVEMTNKTNANDSTVIAWTSEEKNYVLSAFFYGYVIMQVPGGRLAELYGTKNVFGISMIGTTILGALTPLAASYNIWCLFALRVFQGILEGVTYPCLNPMTARWAPEGERNRFMSFAYMGEPVGTVVTYTLGGLILAFTSWEYVFYVSSCAAAVWCLAWFLLVSDLPEHHPRISEEEKKMILATRSFDPVNRDKELKTPLIPLVWDVLKTPAVVVDMVTDHCSGWGNIMIISMSPTFMKDVLHFDIAQNGAMSMLPHLCRAIISQIAGSLSDIGIRQGVPRLTLQKIFLAISFLVSAICLAVMSQLSSPELKWWCVVAMTVGFGFNGTSYSGHYANVISIGPNRSGTTLGLVNMAGNLPGFLMPLVITALTKGHEDSSIHWGYAFWICAGLYGIGTVIFVTSGKIEVQEFNYKEYNKSEEENFATPLPTYRKTGDDF